MKIQLMEINRFDQKKKNNIHTTADVGKWTNKITWSTESTKRALWWSSNNWKLRFDYQTSDARRELSDD